MNAKILVVDDLNTDVLLICHMLSDCEVLRAANGLEALDTLSKTKEIDLIILDLDMPLMNGFEFLEAIRREPIEGNPSIIILTNYNEVDNEIRGLELGAIDYIRKPLNMASLRKRIEVHIKLRQSRICVEKQNQQLEITVYNRTKELIVTRDMTINALVGLLEVRNIESSNHAKRTQHMMKVLCAHLKEQSVFDEILTDDYVRELVKTAPLHDIGKVGIPDSILLKPGKLTTDEFELIKKHTTYGVEALSHDLPEDDIVSFIRTAIEIVGGHHERFDGTGYPLGLKGDEIPLGGRLMAIIDVFDALINKRVYKEAFSYDKAFGIIEEESGRQFDPEIAAAFLDIRSQLIDLADRFAYDHFPKE